MKKFAFRLQVVLDRARDAEEERLRQLALVQGELYRKEEEIRACADKRSALLAAMSTMQQGSFDPWELHQCHLHLDALAGMMKQLRQEYAQIEERVEAARQALVEAMRQRQLLEKLREKQLDEYRQAVAREELRTMEETTLPRLARARAAEQARLLAKR